MAILVFIAVATLTQLLSYQQFLIAQRAQREDAQREANAIADKLKSVLSYSLSATRTLAFVIEEYGEPADFNSIARNILQTNPFIDAMELTRKGVITYVYPLEGNESALGYDILADTLRSKEALKALNENRLFFAGPFELRQGGLAIVGRLPIFREEQFWGFSVVLIRLGTLFETIGLHENENYTYQLAKANPSTGMEEFFLPGTVPADKQFVSVEVPDGSWKLYVIPKMSLGKYSAIRPVAVLGLLLAVTAAMYSWNLARQPQKLRRRVSEATAGMLRVNRLYNFASQINRMAVHVSSETEAFQRACEIAVETGSYTMAWVAILNEHDQTFTCAASAGEGRRYATEITPLSVKNGGPNDPYWQVLRTGKYVCASDIHSDPVMAPWAARAREFGFKSVIVMPIKRAGQTVGAFNLHSSEIGTFDKDEINLLEETASTISFVLDNFEKERRRQEAEQLVRAEKILSESIINSMPGVFYLYTSDGQFLRWNKNFETVSGYTAEEMKSRHPLDFFEGIERKVLKSKIANVFRDGHDDVIAEFVTKDGTRIPYYFNGKRVTFDDQDYLLGMGLDISDRMAAEAQLRERNEEIEKLSAHLQQVREEERARIALEIHDVLGQQLTAIKMDATWIRKKSEAAAVIDRISTMINLIDETVRTVRRISSELRPGILDDLGLVAAIEWQGGEFEKNTGIKVQFTTNVSDVAMARENSTNVFRIYQEALTNVARHSRAAMVKTTLIRSGEKLTLTIADNGVGFDLAEVKKRKSVGLISMKERARNAGGELAIASNNPGGTIVILTIQCAETG